MNPPTTGFSPKSYVPRSNPNASTIRHGSETVEELRKVLKDKEDELANITKKAAELQARLDRVSTVLKTDSKK